jgi:ketosteroid isomerase-like protein
VKLPDEVIVFIVVVIDEKEKLMIGAIIAKKSIAASFEAMNRQDLDEFMSCWREDGVFIYPSEIPESGTYEGKYAIESWFTHFFDKHQKIHFDLQDICVKNIFDLTGTNVIAVHWNVRLKNRDGREAQNNGVAVINIKKGKTILDKDFIFDLGENFRQNWGAV